MMRGWRLGVLAELLDVAMLELYKARLSVEQHPRNAKHRGDFPAEANLAQLGGAWWRRGKGGL
jgi:hypothetical protein